MSALKNFKAALFGNTPAYNVSLTQAPIESPPQSSELPWNFDGDLINSLTVCERIAERRGDEVLRCVYLHGFPFTAVACFKAAASGKIDMIQ